MRSKTHSTDLAVRVATVDHTKVWVELLGTADLATHDHLQNTLSQIQLDGKDEVHVWLHRLTFCDSRALCHLDTFASEVRRRGQSITTHGASRILRKMSAILGTDRRLNLV